MKDRKTEQSSKRQTTPYSDASRSRSRMADPATEKSTAQPEVRKHAEITPPKDLRVGKPIDALPTPPRDDYMRPYNDAQLQVIMDKYSAPIPTPLVPRTAPPRLPSWPVAVQRTPADFVSQGYDIGYKDGYMDGMNAAHRKMRALQANFHSPFPVEPYQMAGSGPMQPFGDPVSPYNHHVMTARPRSVQTLQDNPRMVPHTVDQPRNQPPY